MAKHLELGPDDVIVTVATDGHDMYRSELTRYLQRRHNSRRLDARRSPPSWSASTSSAPAREHVLDATARERARIFNLGYFTWVEQQGIALADFDRRREQGFWQACTRCCRSGTR